MTFGRPAGPPASAQQLRELLALLQDAGHADFRSARGPLRFTQRQAGGKFTREEAATYIDELQSAAADTDDGDDGAAPPAAPMPRLSSTEQAIRRIPTERLAGELQRRGWVVIEP